MFYLLIDYDDHAEAEYHLFADRDTAISEARKCVDRAQSHYGDMDKYESHYYEFHEYGADRWDVRVINLELCKDPTPYYGVIDNFVLRSFTILENAPDCFVELNDVRHNGYFPKGAYVTYDEKIWKIVGVEPVYATCVSSRRTADVLQLELTTGR